MACRLCLYIYEGLATENLNTDPRLSPEHLLTIQTIPDLELGLTHAPLICHTCIKTIQMFSDFKRLVCDHEKKLNIYSIVNCLQQPIDLQTVREFFFINTSTSHCSSDLSVICRICFNNADISDCQDLVPSSFEFIEDCLGKKPILTTSSFVCSSCIDKIEECSDFKDMCLEIQNILCYYKKVTRKFLDNQDLECIARIKGVKKLEFNYVKKEVDALTKRSIGQEPDMSDAPVKIETEECDLAAEESGPNLKIEHIELKMEPDMDAEPLLIPRVVVRKPKKVMTRMLICHSCKTICNDSDKTRHVKYNLKRSEGAQLYKCMDCGSITSLLNKIQCKKCRRMFSCRASLLRHNHSCPGFKESSSNLWRDFGTETKMSD